MSRTTAHAASVAARRPAILSSRFAALLLTLLAALLALTVALPAQAALALGGPGASGPRPAVIDPDAVTELHIHKFEQPTPARPAANGLEQNTDGLTPVQGAEFTAKRVPGIDLTTNAGQATAAGLTVDAAAALIDAADPAVPVAATDTTDPAGDAILAPLGVGLYYVEETVTPPGFTGSEPFLVALPLTNPQTLSGWLTTVHVYPKNARFSISLDVVDRDAVALGDTVCWISRSDIPKLPTIDGYRVVQRIDSRLELIDGGANATVALEVPGQPDPLPLELGTHYTRTVAPDGRTVTIDFTPAGLHELEEIVKTHPAAEVRIDYCTRVLAEGELVNEALLYPSKAIIDGDPGASQPASAKNTTKWGPLTIVVHERGNPSNLIPGAKFKLYLTPEDALAGTNPIEVDGVSEWTTDANGSITIHGLRFSDFVDGLDRDTDDPLYRYYYAMPTSFPPGWTGVKKPQAASVLSTTEAQVLTVVLWRKSGGGGLEVTGAQATGLGLLGAVLLGLGALVLLRRRRDEEPAEQ